MDPTKPTRLLYASAAIDDRVRNPAGEPLGQVKEFAIDLETGRIAYAVLAFGGLLGVGRKLFAIPWQALTLDEDRNEFILDVDREMLEDAPGFDRDEWPATPDREFVEQVYSYYGYEADRR
jgi:hypothetical protein